MFKKGNQIFKQISNLNIYYISQWQFVNKRGSNNTNLDLMLINYAWPPLNTLYSWICCHSWCLIVHQEHNYKIRSVQADYKPVKQAKRIIVHSICIHRNWKKEKRNVQDSLFEVTRTYKSQSLAPAKSWQLVLVYQTNHCMCFYRRILHESNPSLVEHRIPAILQYVPSGQASQVQCFYRNSVGHPRQFVFWYLKADKQELKIWDTMLQQIYIRGFSNGLGNWTISLLLILLGEK